MFAIPPARRPAPATFTELQSYLDAVGLTDEWFRRSVSPLTPAQFHAELDRLAPTHRQSAANRNHPQCSTPHRPLKPAKQTHDHPRTPLHLPECSTFYRDSKSAKRTQHPAPTASTPSNPGNIPQCSVQRPTADSAERTHRSPAAFQSVPPSTDLSPRQERAARLLAAGYTAATAAALLGVERHTIHRYKRLAPFNDQVRRLLAAL